MIKREIKEDSGKNNREQGNEQRMRKGEKGDLENTSKKEANREDTCKLGGGRYRKERELIVMPC